MYVHTHDDLRTTKLPEGMLDAIGDVCCQTYLGLYPDVGSACLSLQLFEQLDALDAILGAVLSVVDHIECHQFAFQAVVAYQHGEVEQLRSYLRVFHAEQDLLVVNLGGIRLQMCPLLKDDLLGGVLGHQCTDDTGEEDHHDDTVEHDIVDQVHAGRHLQSHAHHHHGDGTGSMSRGQAEHHVPVGLCQSEQQAGDISGKGLAKGAEEHDEEHDPQHLWTRKDGADIDEHAHTNQEVRDEQGVADKLDAVHQR